MFIFKFTGIEIKMDRHLLGTPRTNSFLTGGVDLSKLNSRDRRLYKILAEEPVDTSDWAKLTTNKHGKISKSSVVKRSDANTLDISDVVSLPAAQRATLEYIESFKRSCDSLATDKVIYVKHGVNCAYKSKYREWLANSCVGVRKSYAALLSDGGDAFTVIELK